MMIFNKSGSMNKIFLKGISIVLAMALFLAFHITQEKMPFTMPSEPRTGKYFLQRPSIIWTWGFNWYIITGLPGKADMNMASAQEQILIQALASMKKFLLGKFIRWKA